MALMGYTRATMTITIGSKALRWGEIGIAQARLCNPCFYSQMNKLDMQTGLSYLFGCILFFIKSTKVNLCNPMYKVTILAKLIIIILLNI
jgi:hypothetical protein